MEFKLSIPIFLICIITALAAISEDINTDRETTVLEPVEVTSTRVEKNIYKVPFSISLIDKDEIQQGKETISLDESLNKVPGVYVQNRYNFVQDQRISIRGFGSRAAFGVRGIKILYDGIPLTLPDGQSQTDIIDLGSADRIEIIRGPASALYGNSSGGVINIFSETGKENPFVEVKSIFGSYDLYKFNVKTAAQLTNTDFFINISSLDYEGFRDHDKTENILINSNLNYYPSNKSGLTLVFNYINEPTAEDPGALTKEQLNEDRNQAAGGSLVSDSVETVEQLRLGLKFNYFPDTDQNIESLVYIITRDFSQRLPFGIVSFDRIFLGGGLKYLVSKPLFEFNNRFLIGTELEYQRDNRINFAYTEGFDKGDTTLNQKEKVSNLGIYAQDEFSILDNLELTLGLRYDYFKFSVDDSLVENDNPDESGSRTFNQLSPKVGLLYSPCSNINIYSNFSTSFETPTTGELVNKPDGSGGLNPDLEPQETIGFELGTRGVLINKLNYDLSLFYADIKDQLIPFQSENFPDREFFRNAGKSEQYGLEAALDYELIDNLILSLSYTYLNFKFIDFETSEENFDNNEVPGIPKNQLYSEIRYSHPSGLYGAVDLLYVDDFYVNDSNTEKNDSYELVNLRMGMQKEIIKNIVFSPFVGLNNILDEKYNASVRVNAAGGRYFEPAPEFNIYGGFSVRYSMK